MRRPSASTAISIAALMVALSGTAVAGSGLIGSREIAPGAIKARHIAPNAVTSVKIARGAVRGRHIAPFTIANNRLMVAPQPGPRGPQGPIGPAGPQGTPGSPGAPGANGGLDPNKLRYVESPTLTVQPGDVQLIEAACPPGEKVTGGGFFASITHPGGALPHPSLTGYALIVNNDTGIPIEINAYAICVAP